MKPRCHPVGSLAYYFLRKKLYIKPLSKPELKSVQLIQVTWPVLLRHPVYLTVLLVTRDMLPQACPLHFIFTLNSSNGVERDWVYWRWCNLWMSIIRDQFDVHSDICVQRSSLLTMVSGQSLLCLHLLSILYVNEYITLGKVYIDSIDSHYTSMNYW